MNKILDLIKQLGGSKELGEQITMNLGAWKNAQHKVLDEEFEKRLDKAKKACIEETERYKQELAKRVGIFLEARANTITREAQKHAAIGEAKAVRTLKGIASLVEGVEIDTPDHQVADEYKKLRIKVGQLQEQNGKLDLKNKHANQICRQLIDRQRVLESKTSGKEVVTEGKKEKTLKLEGLRVEGSKPKTTRKPIVETIAKGKERETRNGDSDVMAIAESLDGSPALVITE